MKQIHVVCGSLIMSHELWDPLQVFELLLFASVQDLRSCDEHISDIL